MQDLNPKAIHDLWENVEARCLQIKNHALEAERLLSDYADRIPDGVQAEFGDETVLRLNNWPAGLDVTCLFDIRRPDDILIISTDVVAFHVGPTLVQIFFGESK